MHINAYIIHTILIVHNDILRRYNVCMNYVDML